MQIVTFSIDRLNNKLKMRIVIQFPRKCLQAKVATILPNITKRRMLHANIKTANVEWPILKLVSLGNTPSRESMNTK